MYTNVQTLRGYIFHVLQHFATKLGTSTNFRMKVSLTRKSSVDKKKFQLKNTKNQSNSCQSICLRIIMMLHDNEKINICITAQSSFTYCAF